jgi:hypothetical protein
MGAVSPRAIVEEDLPHIVQHTRGGSERDRNVSAVGYMFVPLACPGRRIKHDEAQMIAK